MEKLDMTYLKIIIILENKTGITNKFKDKGKGSSAPFSLDLFIPQMIFLVWF